jgi:hypothetical protein
MRRELKIGLAAALALVIWSACSGENESGPAVPHSVTSTDDSYCLGCHKDGTGGAPKTPHPDRTSCTGCHAVGATGGNDAGSGGTDTGGGSGAPGIPHAITSSDTASCLNCHKDGTGGAPQTTHPDRGICTDCHKSAG